MAILFSAMSLLIQALQIVLAQQLRLFLTYMHCSNMHHSSTIATLLFIGVSLSLSLLSSLFSLLSSLFSLFCLSLMKPSFWTLSLQQLNSDKADWNQYHAQKKGHQPTLLLRAPLFQQRVPLHHLILYLVLCTCMVYGVLTLNRSGQLSKL